MNDGTIRTGSVVCRRKDPSRVGEVVSLAPTSRLRDGRWEQDWTATVEWYGSHRRITTTTVLVSALQLAAAPPQPRLDTGSTVGPCSTLPPPG